jgi:ABC-type polysaccharide/polyol phosphate transport system ATPase subunit
LNGSGKTTLLRLIGGVYRPSNGVVRTEGKIVSFLMTAWPQLRLTVTDNIFLGGALYGLTIEETKEYLLPIVEFAELKEYLGAPLYQLSAGMQERLAIAAFLYIAFGNQAGILLIDELFSNSDINFLNKAIRKLEDFLQTQATILMASHNFEVMVKTCNRIIWLDHGRVVKIGASQEIIKEFIGVNAVASPTQD